MCRDIWGLNTDCKGFPRACQKHPHIDFEPKFRLPPWGQGHSSCDGTPPTASMQQAHSLGGGFHHNPEHWRIASEEGPQALNPKPLSKISPACSYPSMYAPWLDCQAQEIFAGFYGLGFGFWAFGVKDLRLPAFGLQDFKASGFVGWGLGLCGSHGLQSLRIRV